MPDQAMQQLNEVELQGLKNILERAESTLQSHQNAAIGSLVGAMKSLSEWSTLSGSPEARKLAILWTVFAAAASATLERYLMRHYSDGLSRLEPQVQARAAEIAIKETLRDFYSEKTGTFLQSRAHPTLVPKYLDDASYEPVSTVLVTIYPKAAEELTQKFLADAIGSLRQALAEPDVTWEALMDIIWNPLLGLAAETELSRPPG